MQKERLIGYINRRNEQFSNIRKEISISMAGERTGEDGETSEKVSQTAKLTEKDGDMLAQAKMGLS